jgi:fructoselysine-6-P-deglycase FrlB-like protein
VPKVTFTNEEIARQPEAWRRAAQLVKGGQPGLPRKGERVAVVGCGTSWFVAEAYARLREGRGDGRTDAFAASEFPRDRRYDRIMAITRSGTTTEIVELLGAARGQTPTLALTADATTPVVDVADTVMCLPFADERSVVQTVFATTALAALRAHLDEDIQPLADAAENALLDPLPQEAVGVEQITFLGRGWAHGVAREAALKMREACQLWTEAYPTMEYRHGPISIAAPGRLVWHLGAGSGHLGVEVRETGAAFLEFKEDAQVSLVRVQQLAVETAVARGLDPDRPRALARSVVLSDGAS